MANEAILNGTDDVLSVWDGTKYRPFACLTSSTKDKSTTFRERLTKCSGGNTEVAPQGITTSFSIEGLMFDTTSAGGDTAKASYDWIEAQMDAKARLVLKNTVGDADPVYFYAYIESISRTSPAEEDITFSATLRVDGGQMTVDPEA